MNEEILNFNAALADGRRQICELLAQEIHSGLPEATSKVWHGAPVWFIDGNPVAGYDNLKNGVRLLFWSGQSFSEPGLQPEGSFKAAEARYTNVSQVDTELLAKWLQNAQDIQWDYKNIVKNRGVLSPIKGL